jgi:hypothetical protein
VIVSWPSGYLEAYTAIAANRRLTLTELDAVAVDEEEQPAPRLALTTRGPNPTRGEIALGVALPSRTQVRLTIFDVRGRSVSTLLDGIRDAGWHPLTWTCRNPRGFRVAAGVYFARLEALGEARTRKIVVMK